LPAMLAASPDTLVIALTMQEGPGFASRALAAGARGYVLKEAVETELLGALRAVAAGRRFLDPRVGAAIAADLPLTEREQTVLRLLALGNTNVQVANRLSFSERTIEACRAQIRQKLGISDRADLTEYALSQGILAPATGYPPGPPEGTGHGQRRTPSAGT